MVLEYFSRLWDIWPFSSRKLDDLKVSERLVRRLSLSEQTKRFVFAIHEPESQAVIYILAAQSLSERAAMDAECLIREVRPEAVVAQISRSGPVEILAEGSKSRENLVNSIPTSSFGVLKDCIVNKINKDMYENMAGNLVLQEIFGIGFHGHLLTAKRAAAEVGSSFHLFRSPLLTAEGNTCNESNIRNKFQALLLQQRSLIPQKVGSVSPRRFSLTDDLQLQMVKSMSSYIASSASESATPVSEVETGDRLPRCNYQAPPFAQPIYPLLTDLHDIFVDLPSIGWALVHAQKMLSDVDRGKSVDAQLLSKVQTFRIAVEGLRIALNNAARCPINKMDPLKTARTDLSELPLNEKSHVLLAQALRSQTKNFKSIVAIVEASSLGGIRKHWKTSISREAEDLVKQSLTKYEGDEESVSITSVEGMNSTDKTMVALVAGATAVLGASSIPRLTYIPTFIKLITLNVPVSLKLILAYTQKAAILTLGKTFGSSNLVAHGIASYGVKTTSATKLAASAQKIRAVVHSIIASAERTSFSIMRTAFYEIMRKRGVQPTGSMLRLTFGCGLVMWTGLFIYGDGIECAAESLPAAPSIACLGRGIRNLHQASQEAKRANSSRIQEMIESLLYSTKNIKIHQ